MTKFGAFFGMFNTMRRIRKSSRQMGKLSSPIVNESLYLKTPSLWGLSAMSS
ncbi:hypothetical protein QBE53_15660 [Vallitaleaceae bacterium 9-2]